MGQNVRLNEDLLLGVARSLSSIGVKRRLLVVVQGHTILGKVFIVDGSFDVERIPHHRLSIGDVCQLILRQRISLNVVLVDVVSWLDAVTFCAVDREGHVLVAHLSLTRVDETDALDLDSSATVSSDQAWLSIDDIWVIETERDVVIRVVEAIESDLDGQHIRLGVHWNLTSDCAV